MQRKNSILKTTHKNAMAMVMAIIVIVVISTIMALSLSLTTQTSKKTSDLYLYEQAVILSHSAAEYAMLRASLVNDCNFSGTNFTYNSAFDINISMKYIATNPSTCYTNANTQGILYSTVAYPASNGTVVMDITVTSTLGTEPIRYFRRSIQKL
jgi:type II secretory pathway pseudopilin PulG